MTRSSLPTLGIGMVGYAFMGAAHSQAWRTVGRVFDLPLSPGMVALCGRDAAAADRAAATLGWQSSGTDWRELVERPDIDLIDICTPGDTHAEIAIAALEAGKHVLCEKPLANTVEEAEAMAAAAERARARGVRSMVGFNYRRVPAVTLARALVQEGRVGTVRHVRAVYLQDWIVDPEFPLVWRLQKEHAGSGALGDIGAHIVDLAQFMVGEQLTGVSGAHRDVREGTPVGVALQRSGRDWPPGARSGDRRRRRAFLGSVLRRRRGLVRGDALRDRPQERSAHRDQRVHRQPRLRLRGDERAVRSTTARTIRRPPVSAGSSSPSRPIPTCRLGGRPVTCSATSTRSPTRSATSSSRSVPSRTRSRRSRDGLQVQQALEAVELSAANRSCWQDIPAI